MLLLRICFFSRPYEGLLIKGEPLVLCRENCLLANLWKIDFESPRLSLWLLGLNFLNFVGLMVINWGEVPPQDVSNSRLTSRVGLLI